MADESGVGGILGVIGGIIGTLGGSWVGVRWFLEWYAKRNQDVSEATHKHRMETAAAEQQREKARSDQYLTVESAIATHYKSILSRQEKQIDRQEKQIQSLLADGEKKQALIDALAKDAHHCRENFAASAQWMKYANGRLRSLDPEWDMDPPELDLNDTDFDFQARTSAQDTAVLKAMTKEGQP